MQRADGAKIRALRQARELTVEQVAVRAEIGGSSLRAIETGVVEPRRTTLRAIAHVLGVEVDELTADDGAAVSA